MKLPAPQMYHMCALITIAITLSMPHTWLLFLQTHIAVVHETCHALVIWLTGGDVTSFVVSYHGGGSVTGSGGHRFTSLIAGYVGVIVFAMTSLYGVVMRNDPSWVLSAAIIWLVLWVLLFHNIMTDYSVMVVWRIVGIAVLLHLVPTITLRLGLFCYLVAFAVLGLHNIVDNIILTIQPSDATTVARYYGGTRVMWGLIWLLSSVVCVMYGYYTIMCQYINKLDMLHKPPK